MSCKSLFVFFHLEFYVMEGGDGVSFKYLSELGNLRPLARIIPSFPVRYLRSIQISGPKRF